MIPIRFAIRFAEWSLHIKHRCHIENQLRITFCEDEVELVVTLRPDINQQLNGKGEISDYKVLSMKNDYEIGRRLQRQVYFLGTIVNTGWDSILQNFHDLIEEDILTAGDVDVLAEFNSFQIQNLAVDRAVLVEHFPFNLNMNMFTSFHNLATELFPTSYTYIV
jgi:hypothetical protein